MPTVDQVVSKYVELRDRKAEIEAKHKEELRPLREALDSLEAWLMDQLNKQGVDSFKTKQGTAYKSVSTATSMADPIAFKSFVFDPAIKGLTDYLTNSGYELRDVDVEMFSQILRDSTRWDVVDFRAGKKGIVEYMEQTDQTVPGVTFSKIATVNVRRA